MTQKYIFFLRPPNFFQIFLFLIFSYSSFASCFSKSPQFLPQPLSKEGRISVFMQCRFSVLVFTLLAPFLRRGGQGGGIEAGYKKEIILTINKL